MRGGGQNLRSFRGVRAIFGYVFSKTKLACLSLVDDAMISPPREPVTIAELKRHMDRRFDRLERTKADKSDLRRFAAKSDLRRFAAKTDLRRFATKMDLRRFATKKDLRRFAVDIKRHFTVVAESLEEKIQRLADGVAEVNAIKLRGLHHDKVLDDHETRITALERNV
jgi:hypothetical protein